MPLYCLSKEDAAQSVGDLSKALDSDLPWTMTIQKMGKSEDLYALSVTVTSSDVTNVKT